MFNGFCQWHSSDDYISDNKVSIGHVTKFFDCDGTALLKQLFDTKIDISICSDAFSEIEEAATSVEFKNTDKGTSTGTENVPSPSPYTYVATPLTELPYATTKSWTQYSASTHFTTMDQKTIKNTRIATIWNTPFSTLINTQFQTLFNTPFSTLINTLFQTLFDTPLKTIDTTLHPSHAGTPFDSVWDTPFSTLGKTPIETIWDTPFSTLSNTLLNTLFDTPLKTIDTTLRPSHAGTPFASVWDTPFSTLIDTAKETLVETLYDTPFATLFDTPFDTPFGTPFRTLDATMLATTILPTQTLQAGYVFTKVQSSTKSFLTKSSTSFTTFTVTWSQDEKGSSIQITIPTSTFAESMIYTDSITDIETQFNNADSGDVEEGSNLIVIIAAAVSGVILIVIIALLVWFFVGYSKSSSSSDSVVEMDEETVLHVPDSTSAPITNDNPLWTTSVMGDTDDPFRNDFEEVAAEGFFNERAETVDSDP
jgi:hypothetical protein